MPGLDSIWINPQPTASPRRTTRETPRRERLFEAACSDVEQKQLDRGATWVWQSAEEAQRRGGDGGDGGGENTEREREKQLWNRRESHRGRMDGQRKDRTRHRRQRRREIFSLINRCLNFNYRWPQSSVRRRENESESTTTIRTGTAYVRGRFVENILFFPSLCWCEQCSHSSAPGWYQLQVWMPPRPQPRGNDVNELQTLLLYSDVRVRCVSSYTCLATSCVFGRLRNWHRNLFKGAVCSFGDEILRSRETNKPSLFSWLNKLKKTNWP